MSTKAQQWDRKLELCGLIVTIQPMLLFITEINSTFDLQRELVNVDFISFN